MTRNPLKPHPKSKRRPPKKDVLTSTQPAHPWTMEKPAPRESETEQMGNRNNLARRDPSGARGQRDRQGMTDKAKTKR